MKKIFILGALFALLSIPAVAQVSPTAAGAEQQTALCLNDAVNNGENLSVDCKNALNSDVAVSNRNYDAKDLRGSAHFAVLGAAVEVVIGTALLQANDGTGVAYYSDASNLLEAVVEYDELHPGVLDPNDVKRAKAVYQVIIDAVSKLQSGAAK